MTMIRLPSVRMTDTTRFSLTVQGRIVLATAPTCPGCPRCGLPLPEVTGLNSSFYECSERHCHFETAKQPLPVQEAEVAQ